jgi:hypothetical protein
MLDHVTGVTANPFCYIKQLAKLPSSHIPKEARVVFAQGGS